MKTSSRLPCTLQELPPQGARLCLEVRRFLHTLEEGHDPCSFEREMIVAFSGGADSTALALVLRCLGLSICLVHLDHALRPESAEEAHAATVFAERLGVPCFLRRVDVHALARECATGLEDAGRQARYRFLEDVRQARQAGWIATGHHLHDLSEDVLLRLTRGTGWPALGGMTAVDQDRHLVRPILTLPRDRLIVFLRDLGVNWIEDASNQSDAFLRNRLRKQVVPLLQAENPAFGQAVLSLWELAREDDAYWNDLLYPVFARLHSECATLPETRTFFLPREAFIELPRAARLRVYAGMIRRFGRGQAQSDTLFRLDVACTTSRSCKIFQLPGNLSFRTDRTGLTLYATSNFSIGKTSDTPPTSV